MARLARWCFRHRISVVVAWLVALSLVAGLQSALRDSFSDSLRLPGTESSRAFELLSSALPQQAGESGTIVWHSSAGFVNDPAAKTRMQSLLGEVAALPAVESVSSPYEPAGAGQISADGKTAYATVKYSGEAGGRTCWGWDGPGRWRSSFWCSCWRCCSAFRWTTRSFWSAVCMRSGCIRTPTAAR